ncbi:hypothetical protein [Jeotgalibacillus marinus]|uniref:Uncharacterized protein n=1 Tax=Jeotgalibacillus marinus TaxID=86667 RepID=A0ABV3Q637_9BACL
MSEKGSEPNAFTYILAFVAKEEVRILQSSNRGCNDIVLVIRRRPKRPKI